MYVFMNKWLLVLDWLSSTHRKWHFVVTALLAGNIGTTKRSATILHDWFTIVRYYPSKSFKVNDLYLIWKPVCDFLLVINSNLGPILHYLATIHPWQTERRTNKQRTTTHANSSTFTKVRLAKNILSYLSYLTNLHCKSCSYYSLNLGPASE